MSATINSISARWVLDSRGIPTVSCKTTISVNGQNFTGKAGVPSGASTGTYEAVELRDGGTDFGGKGVSKAIDNLVNQIGKNLIGKEFENASQIDQFILDMEASLEYQLNRSDISPKSVLGANAILGISMAAHRAFASSQGLELWEYLRQEYFADQNGKTKFPRVMCNIFNGGVHASNNLDIQEFMVVPNTNNIEQDVKMASEIYQKLKSILKKGGQSVAVGDEGGFAPNYNGTKEVLNSVEKAIAECGYTKAVCDISLDCASNEFFDKESNTYNLDGVAYSQSALTDFYAEITAQHNILSIEDGFSEDDILGWELMTAKLGKKQYLIGDDLFVTNPERFQKIGLKNNLANGILIKLNQIGSVIETAKMINMAKENNYVVAVSHRSGETNDDFISDLAFACQSEFIKLGAPARGERVAKFNRLLDIYEDLQ
jgi:enolase